MQVMLDSAQQPLEQRNAANNLVQDHEQSYGISEDFYRFPRLYLSRSIINQMARKSNSIYPSIYTNKQNIITTELEQYQYPFILQPSLFSANNVPPTIFFKTNSSGDERPPIGLPKPLKRYFRWKMTRITPNSIRNCVKFMQFETVSPSNEDDNVFICSWYKHMHKKNYIDLEPWRKVNHFPGSFHIGRKDKLAYHLKVAFEKFENHGFGRFHPQTFIMPRDYEILKQSWSEKPDKLFIIKPPASARGTGIQVINNINLIPGEYLEDDGNRKKSTLIVQEYLSNPCLLHNGHKFDLRIYVLLTSINPLRLYIYEDGLVRFASTKYDHSNVEILDQFMHLTNYFVNKKNCEYQINDDTDSLHGSKWTLKRFWKYLQEHYSDKVDTEELWVRIKDIIIKTFISAESMIRRLSNEYCKNDYTSFEIFGFDIILDDSFNPWILEVNITPSLKSESNLDMVVKYGVIQDMLNIVGYNLLPVASSELKGTSNYKLFDERLYKPKLTNVDLLKRHRYLNATKTSDASILEKLTQEDIRVLILSEDELSRSGRFSRIFPTSETEKYFPYFTELTYYNLLLSEWEKLVMLESRLNCLNRLSKEANFL